MKKIFLLVIIVTSIKAYSQRHAVLPINSDNKICYSGVIDIPSKNQEKLYNDSKEYVLLNYTSREFPTILDEKNDRISIAS